MRVIPPSLVAVTLAAALYQALGRGWWNRKTEAAAANEGGASPHDVVAAR